MAIKSRMRLKKKSMGVYTMLEGSLYPILYRLTEMGCISDYEKLVGKRRTRRYYHIEPKGKEYYKKFLLIMMRLQQV